MMRVVNRDSWVFLVFLDYPWFEKQELLIFKTRQMQKTLTVMIEWNEKVVEFKEVYTRKNDRDFNQFLFEWEKPSIDSNWKTTFNMSPLKFHEWNDFLVKMMTNLSQEEIDVLPMADYNKILEIIWEIKDWPVGLEK